MTWKSSRQVRKVVIDEVKKARVIVSQFLKDSTPVSTAAVRTGGGTSSSNTKKEAMQLPRFSGEEKGGQAFLKYPIWSKRWKSQITDYEDKYRATMLMSHVDAEVQKKLVGLETEYEKAMEKLDRYYGDTRKVVQACTVEVKGHPQVSSFDYKGLLSLKTCLKNNYARLKYKSLEHEMSNSHTMEIILKKFLLQENVKWSEHLAEMDARVREKPFLEFMKWLDKAGSSWELLAAQGTGAKSGSGSRSSYFGGQDGGGHGDNSSFGCG